MTTNRPHESNAHRQDSSRRVVVGGDVTIDWSLARTRALGSECTGGIAEDRVETSRGPGGAALLSHLITEFGMTLAGTGLAVEVSGPTAPGPSVAPGDPRFHHSYATWAQFPRRAGERGHTAWRVEESLGVDPARLAEPHGVDLADAAGHERADLVILEDANRGFRDQPERWPMAVTTGADADRSPWVVLNDGVPR